MRYRKVEVESRTRLSFAVPAKVVMAFSRKRLVEKFQKGKECDIAACPYSGLNHVHINAVCPEPSASNHEGHACGFSVASKQAKAMPDGVLVGFCNQAANAEAWAAKNLGVPSVSRSGRARSGFQVFGAKQICCAECPYHGQRHAHCYDCRCLDDVHTGHSCGFVLAQGDLQRLSDGSLVGWLANTDRDVAAHHLRYHSKSHPAPPSCANPSDFTAWVTRKQARLTFRDKKETCGSQDTGQDEQPSSVCQSAPAADEREEADGRAILESAITLPRRN